MLDATTTTFRMVSLTFTTRPASIPPSITRPTLILPMCAPPFRLSATQNHPRGRCGGLLLGPPRPLEPGAPCPRDPSLLTIDEIDARAAPVRPVPGRPRSDDLERQSIAVHPNHDEMMRVVGDG